MKVWYSEEIISELFLKAFEKTWFSKNLFIWTTFKINFKIYDE